MWRSFRSLWTLSFNLKLELTRGFISLTFIVIIPLATLMIMFSYSRATALRHWPGTAGQYGMFGEWINHLISPEFFVSESVFPSIALNPSVLACSYRCVCRWTRQATPILEKKSSVCVWCKLVVKLLAKCRLSALDECRPLRHAVQLCPNCIYCT